MSDMKEWNPTKDDLLNLKESILNSKNAYDNLIFKKRQLEFDLSQINHEVRRTGKMPDDQYAAHCENQSRIKKELLDLGKPINELNLEISRKHLMVDRIKSHLLLDKSLSSGIKEKLIEIRDRYNDFSSDETRASGTRIMASKFVEEVQELLNLITTK